jgi:two-component system, response regulator
MLKVEELDLNKRILLVEDNLDDVALTLRAFKKNKILNEIIVANDGVEALDYLFGTGKYAGRNIEELPTIILLDLKLPRMDGFEVLKRIRADVRTRTVPVVILTSSKEEEDLIKGYKLGCNSFIRKSVDFNQFMDAVKEIGIYWLLINETISIKK